MNNDEISIEFGVIFKLLSNSVELEYPLNIEILRMGGKDASGNDIFFKITYLREDGNSHKMVISDGPELEKDLKIFEDIRDWVLISGPYVARYEHHSELSVHVKYMFIHFKSTRIKSISIISDAKINCKLKLLTGDRTSMLHISSNDQLLSRKEILRKTFINVEYPNRKDDT